MERIMPYEEKPSAHCVRPFKVPEEFLEREKVRGARKVELAPPFGLRPRSRTQDEVVSGDALASRWSFRLWLNPFLK